jgi:hypothetical protein
MTDTATETTKRSQKPRDVDYTLEIVDDLPESAMQRRSPLEDQIDRIVATPDSHGRFVRIGSYANGSAASAAANVLRKRHGDKPTVDGYEIRTARSDVNGTPRTGLFVKYDPNVIIPGERDQFEQRLKDREAKVNERRREKAAAAKEEAAASASTPKAKTK